MRRRLPSSEFLSKIKKNSSGGFKSRAVRHIGLHVTSSGSCRTSRSTARIRHRDWNRHACFVYFGISVQSSLRRPYSRPVGGHNWKSANDGVVVDHH